MLLTRRMERARARPLGFVANEYALAVWGVRAIISHMIRQGTLDLATPVSILTCSATIRRPGLRNPR